MGSATRIPQKFNKRENGTLNITAHNRLLIENDAFSPAWRSHHAFFFAVPS